MIFVVKVYHLFTFHIICYFNFGGVAHLGERLNGIQEVVGSIPIISTKKDKSCDLSFFIHCESNYMTFILKTAFQIPRRVLF